MPNVPQAAHTIERKFVCIARSSDCKCTATAFATVEMHVTKLQITLCKRDHQEKLDNLTRAAESAVLLMVSIHLDANNPLQNSVFTSGEAFISGEGGIA